VGDVAERVRLSSIVDQAIGSRVQLGQYLIAEPSTRSMMVQSRIACPALL
jgi:hypothetical protein